MVVSPEANEAHIPALPDPAMVRARVDRVLDELLNGRPEVKSPGYLTEVPRVGPELDNLDRAVRKMGFPDDPTWRGLLLADSPATAYKVTPEGASAGSVIRLRNDGPVKGISSNDKTEVNLPKALADIAYAGSETGHALMLDHYYEAGMLKPGEMGRYLEAEAKTITASLRLPENQNPDVAGGRILDNLDAVHETVSAVLSEEEMETPVGRFPIRPEEIKIVLDRSLESLALQPELALDEMVIERLDYAAGAYHGLRMVEEAKNSATLFGIGQPERLAIDDPRVWVGAKGIFSDQGMSEVNYRIADLDPKAAEQFEARGLNPLIATNEIVSRHAAKDIAVAYVEGWVRESADSQRQADQAIRMFRAQIPYDARRQGIA